MNTFLLLFRIANSAVLYVCGHFIGIYIVSYFHQRTMKKIKDEETKMSSKKDETKFQDKYKNIIIRKKYFEDHCDSSSDESDCSSIELYEKPTNKDDFTEFFKKKYVSIEHEIYKKMHMMWNPENNQYVYFCRTREIPYDVLDVLCRKFVLTYDLCDNYVINFHHDINIDEQETESQSEQDNDADDEGELIPDECDDFEDITEPKTNSVFSMLKKTKERKENREKHNKNINNFKYGGNIFDFNNLISESPKDKETKKINYSQFKFEKDMFLKTE